MSAAKNKGIRFTGLPVDEDGSESEETHDDGMMCVATGLRFSLLHLGPCGRSVVPAADVNTLCSSWRGKRREGGGERQRKTIRVSKSKRRHDGRLPHCTLGHSSDRSSATAFRHRRCLTKVRLRSSARKRATHLRHPLAHAANPHHRVL